MFKHAVENPGSAVATDMFNWGLRISDFTELYLLTARGDVDEAFRVRHPGDPLAQVRGSFAHHGEMLNRAGYSWDDVVLVDVTVTNAFDLERNLQGLIAIFAETFKEVAVKPAAGTLRVVEALPFPDLLIELQMLAAR